MKKLIESFLARYISHANPQTKWDFLSMKTVSTVSNIPKH